MPINCVVSNTLYEEAPGQVVVGNSNNIMQSNAVVECLPHTWGGGGGDHRFKTRQG